MLLAEQRRAAVPLPVHVHYCTCSGWVFDGTLPTYLSVALTRFPGWLNLSLGWSLLYSIWLLAS